MNRKSMSKLLCGLLAGGICLSSSVLANADTNSNTNTDRKIAPHFNRMKKDHNKGGMLKEIIEEEIKEGNITQEQVDNIKAKMIERVNAEREQLLEEKLNDLIEKEILNKEQAEKIKEVLQEEQNTRKELFEQVKELSKEERREFLQNYREEHKEPLQKLVDEGVITQEQRDAMRENLAPRKDKINNFRKHGKVNFEQGFGTK